MDKTFEVSILTPEKQFVSDSYEAVIFTGLDGEICILKDHIAMLSAVKYGIIKLKKNGEWKNLVSDNGFAEVHSNSMKIFVNRCEWAENMEEAMRQIEIRKKEELESVRRHRVNTIGLARTVYGFGKTEKKSRNI